MEQRQHKQLIIIVTICFIVFTSILISLIAANGYQQRKTEFNNQANVVYQSLVDTALINKVILEGFVSLVGSTNEFPHYKTVKKYTEKVKQQYPHIYMLELQQAVPKHQISEFIKSFRSAGYPEYQIKTFSYDTDRKWQPLPEQNIYYPVTFMSPFTQEAKEILGLDVTSVPFLARAINDVIQKGGTSASKPFDLVEGGRAYVLFQTVPNQPNDIASILVSTSELLNYLDRFKLSGQVSLKYPDYEGNWLTETQNEKVNKSSFLGEYLFAKDFDDFGQPFTLQITQAVKWQDFNISIMLLVCFSSLIFFTLIYRLLINLLKTKLLLSKSNQTLKSNIEEKNRLFTNISHELRTPLTLILNPLKQLSNNDKLTKSQHKLLNIAQSNSARLFQLVEKILSLTTLEDNKKQLETVLINDQLIKHIIAFEPLFKEKNISLKTNLSSHCKIEADVNDLSSIADNLLTNALKYTPANGWVKLNSEITNNHFQLVIENSNKGLNEDETEKVFERFERLGQSDCEQGFGLGLAYVKDICQQNNWQIKCDSIIGHSVSFHLTISDFSVVKADNLSPAQRQINQLDIKENSKPNKHKQSLLIVEDNSELRDFLNDIFSIKYSVITASNGLLGVNTAIEEIPDLIISDVMMPELNGYQLVEQLTQHDNTCHIPIMLLTAKADKESQLKGLEYGSIDYISKPFDATELLLKVENILARKLSLLNTTQSTDKQNHMQYISERDKNFIEKLNNIIEESYIDSGFSVEQLVDQIAMSERQLQRKLKAVFNQTPAEFIRDYRLQKSKKLLLAGKSISNTADLVGFNSSSYFSRSFKSTFNQSPSEFIQDKVTA